MYYKIATTSLFNHVLCPTSIENLCNSLKIVTDPLFMLVLVLTGIESLCNLLQSCHRASFYASSRSNQYRKTL